MARFERNGTTLHVFKDGHDSIKGVYEGVETIFFHSGVCLEDIVYLGIKAKTLNFLGFSTFYKMGEHDCYFPCVETINLDYASLTSYDLMDMLIASDEDAISHDVNINVYGEVFTIRKGTSMSVFHDVFCAFVYLADTYITISDRRRHKRRYNPMLWIDSYFGLVDAGKGSEASRKYVHRFAGHELKEKDYFSRTSDATIIRLVNEDLITKANMKILLDMANDAGRVDVAAAIIEKTAPRRRVVSRFAI